MSEKYCPYCMTKEKGTFCPKCGLAAQSYISAAHHLPAGTVLAGRYAVGRTLGEGGFGITYIGIDTKLELKVAIKEYYPSGWANRYSAASLTVSHNTSQEENYKKGKERFIREAKTMAMLDKQTEIATVRDFFESNRTAYIVMEYVDGITLKSRVQSQGPIPASEIFSLIEPVMGALKAMHGKGLIHRDISPDNLMLERGRLRLIDFGCARESLAGDATMTIMLKHGFSPIEQYQRKGQGPWSDVYALCATLYYCLTGRVPPQAVDRIVEDTIIPPGQIGVNLTANQEAALLKGMAVRIQDRYQSIDELYKGLYGEAYSEGGKGQQTQDTENQDTKECGLNNGGNQDNNNNDDNNGSDTGQENPFGETESPDFGENPDRSADPFGETQSPESEGISDQSSDPFAETEATDRLGETERFDNGIGRQSAFGYTGQGSGQSSLADSSASSSNKKIIAIAIAAAAAAIIVILIVFGSMGGSKKDSSSYIADISDNEETTAEEETTAGEDDEAETEEETGEETEEETEAQEETTAETTQQTTQETTTQAPSSVSDVRLKTDYYYVTIPGEFTGLYSYEYTTTNNGVMNEYQLAFYHDASVDAGTGGWLFSIYLFTDSTDYSYLPEYEYFGRLVVKQAEVYHVVIVYPSDVEYSDKTEEEYRTIYNSIDEIMATFEPTSEYYGFYPAD